MYAQHISDKDIATTRREMITSFSLPGNGTRHAKEIDYRAALQQLAVDGMLPLIDEMLTRFDISNTFKELNISGACHGNIGKANNY